MALGGMAPLGGKAIMDALGVDVRTTLQRALSAMPDPGAMMARMAQAAPTVQFTIQSEMRAWESDHNPAHLLRVIELQRNLLEHHSAVMGATAAQSNHLAVALENVMGQVAGAAAAHAAQPAAKRAGPPPLAKAAMSTSAMAQTQQSMQNLSNTMRMMSEITKTMHDTQMSIIRNLR